jgi:tetratricopeptide (TPR) repeat protein
MTFPRSVLGPLCAALVAALALPVQAQLGIDLSGAEKKEAEKKQKKEKPKKEKKGRKPAEKKVGPKPERSSPPGPAQQATPTPAPPPAPRLEEQAAPPPTRTEVKPVPLPPPPLPRPAAKPAPAPGFQGVDVAGTGLGKPRLDAAKKLLADKEWEAAALAFDAIVRDPQLAEVHDEARFRLAVALAQAGFFHSALARFDDVLSLGAQGSRFFANSLEWIFYLGRRTANESVILSRVARFAGEPVPPGAQDKFRYLLARYNYERGLALAEAGQAAESRQAYAEARRIASTVRGETPAVPMGGEEGVAAADGNLPARARFVEALVLYAQGDSQAAVEAFKDVVRLTNPRRAKLPDPRLRELAFLELGRIHYEYRQNRYAIFYYQRMPWGGPSWLEGLWESSYAYYRIGDYEKALGNLITLHSPYFGDEYFPESHILKAIIYYENCRYPEARGILERFNADYEPVFGELERLTGSTAPQGLFDLLDAVRKGRAQSGPALRKVSKAVFTDRNIERLDASIGEVEGEIDRKLPQSRDPFRGSALAQDLKRRLEGERARLVAEATARARQKLEYERDALRELLQQALRIQIEVSRQEREALEMALTSGGKGEVVRPYKFSAAVSDEHQFWPYEGEFWRDELGTYAYTLTKGCREGPAAGQRR